MRLDEARHVDRLAVALREIDLRGCGALRRRVIGVIARAYLVSLERSSACGVNGAVQLTPESRADHRRVACRTALMISRIWPHAHGLALMAAPAWLGGRIAGSAGPRGGARSPPACARIRWCSAVAGSGARSARSARSGAPQPRRSDGPRHRAWCPRAIRPWLAGAPSTAQARTICPRGRW